MTDDTDTTGAADERHALDPDVADEVERLTRLATRAVDDAEATAYRDRRDDLLADHGYTCRVRDDGGGRTLVCYPTDWLGDDGRVRVERVTDTDRAVERPLTGPGDPEDWDGVDEHNRAVAERVREEYGDVHGATARAFADFMSNHYARPVESATPAELREFREDYFPRNAWPSEEQRETVEQSLELVLRVADAE